MPTKKTETTQIEYLISPITKKSGRKQIGGQVTEGDAKLIEKQINWLKDNARFFTKKQKYGNLIFVLDDVDCDDPKFAELAKCSGWATGDGTFSTLTHRSMDIDREFKGDKINYRMRKIQTDSSTNKLSQTSLTRVTEFFDKKNIRYIIVPFPKDFRKNDKSAKAMADEILQKYNDMRNEIEDKLRNEDEDHYKILNENPQLFLGIWNNQDNSPFVKGQNKIDNQKTLKDVVADAIIEKAGDGKNLKQLEKIVGADGILAIVSVIGLNTHSIFATAKGYEDLFPEEIKEEKNQKNQKNQKKTPEFSNPPTMVQIPKGGSRKSVRKHRGIVQTGGSAGRLRKGYKYTGRRLKNGQAEIKKVKQTRK
jgi:hypothetical protein